MSELFQLKDRVLGDVVDSVDTTEYHLGLWDYKNSDWRFLDILYSPCQVFIFIFNTK
jgi:hypothetical protein